MNSSLRTRASLAALLFGALLSACGPGAASDAGAEASTGPKPTCDRIAEACHPLHEMGGTPHECHEFSEASATTELQCQMRETECLAACPPSRRARATLRAATRPRATRRPTTTEARARLTLPAAALPRAPGAPTTTAARRCCRPPKQTASRC